MEEKLTKHQEMALKLFPDDGWHKISSLDDDLSSYYFQVHRPEYTAELLEKNGYLISRIKPDNWNPKTDSVYALYYEYKKIKPN